MARVIANFFGVVKNGNNYIETKAGLVTWMYGHILEQAPPEAYGANRYPGKIEDFPIRPKTWKLDVKKDTEGLFKSIKELVFRKDVDIIVNGGDPDREGQLLVDEVLGYVGNKKTVKRLWLNETSDSAVKKAVASLEPNSKYENFSLSARSRSKADWLVGMNMSRLAALVAGTGTYSVGRVQTPVLNIVAMRQKERENFVSKKFWVPVLTVDTPKGSFKVEWRGDRMLSEEDAKLIIKGIVGGNVHLDVEKKKEKVAPPLPWSMTGLSGWAGKTMGLKPSQTLAYVQTLYEEGYVTYPRVDCEYYPEERYPASKFIVPNLVKHIPSAANADLTLKSRAWDTSKTTAHHAIMPTDKIPNRLDQNHLQIYLAIAKVYVAQFFGPLVMDSTTISFESAGEKFSVTGKIIVDKGFTEVWPSGIKEVVLPDVANGSMGHVSGGVAEERKTSPPPAFTASSLGVAMKNIARYIDNKEYKKLLSDTDGLGTEATRPAIIDGLLKRGYLIEEDTKAKSKPLIVTQKGFDLLNIVPEPLKDPVMSALWEKKLTAVYEGRLSEDDFINDVMAELSKWCDDAKKKIKGNYVWETRVVASPSSAKKSVPRKKAASSPKPKTTKSDDQKETFGRCPQCKTGKMVLRKGTYGEFFGCSAYPKCKHTAKV